jgi:hypothetical protein
MFEAAVIQMQCDSRDMQNNYWTILEQLRVPFYGNVTEYNQFYHISQFMHFCDGMIEPERT